MKRKIIAITLTAIITALSIFGCNKNTKTEENSSGIVENTTSNKDNGGNSVTSEKFDIDVTYSDKEKLSVTKDDLSKYTNILNLDGNSISITKSGEYVLTGEISDGQIIVDVPDTDDKVVTLILNGVTVNCSDSAAICVKNAKKVVLSLVDGTTNSFTDASDYKYDNGEDEPNACIFSKDDLVIAGNGTLNVNGNFNNGIYSKDDLTITGGKLKVKSLNDGIKGKDSIAILSADINVEAGGDGICSSNDTDEGKGFISIEGGKFKILSGQDGIQAETCLEIKGGDFDITTGEGAQTTSWDNEEQWGRPEFDFNNPFNSGDFTNNAQQVNTTNTTTDTVSMKAIKSGVDITISGGSFTINSEDDAIHTNGTLEIGKGDFDIKSGDDGIHADNTLVINGGDINISQCYEGIEATYITINDGNIHVVSSDDGFNAAGGNDSSATQGRPGRNPFSGSTGELTFNGGYVYVNTSGDGIDANGTININDGYIIVDGPASGGNGALDYDSGCKMTGGFLLAVGYSSRAQMPSEASINCVMIGFDEYIDGQLVNIADSDNNSIITFKGSKSFNNMVICTSLLEKGKTYIVSTGGDVDGDIEDGICSGSYANGSQYESFAINGTTTTVGNSIGGMGGMGPGGQMPGGQNPGKPGERPGGGRR